ncbi:MAG: hypothetical protein ACRDT6_27355 [Micromonosporaceae bacterium]
MDATTIRRGAGAGMVGGAMMAMFAMVAMWLDGSAETGFWTPVNLIAHTLWRGAPLDAEFSIGALLAVTLHMMMAMAVATIVGRVARLGTGLGSRVFTGVGIALMVWAVMEYIAWPLFDRVAADAFTTWIFAASHVMFGMVTAATLYLLVNRRSPVTAKLAERTAV